MTFRRWFASAGYRRAVLAALRARERSPPASVEASFQLVKYRPPLATSFVAVRVATAPGGRPIDRRQPLIIDNTYQTLTVKFFKKALFPTFIYSIPSDFFCQGFFAVFSKKLQRKPLKINNLERATKETSKTSKRCYQTTCANVQKNACRRKNAPEILYSTSRDRASGATERYPRLFSQDSVSSPQRHYLYYQGRGSRSARNLPKKFLGPPKSLFYATYARKPTIYTPALFVYSTYAAANKFRCILFSS